MKMQSWIAGILVLLLICGCTTQDQQTMPSMDRDGLQNNQTVTGQETPGVKKEEPPLAPAAEKAEELLKNMTLEEKVGQMFLARCPENNAAEKAERYGLGGYVLFARDFEGQTPEGIRTKLQSYQDAVAVPMLISVDEEGGTVVRISRYDAFREERFLSPQQLYAKGGLGAVAEDTIEKADFLKALGINVNLAPVCDVSQEEKDFIYERAFGQDAENTAEYVKTVVAAMREKKIGSVLKHFPGYGNNVDTHTGIAVDGRAWETLQSADLLPFAAGIEEGADAVLVSHNIVRCLDEENPASLSVNVHNLLRYTMGFEGVIMTDDLSMEAIRQFAGDQEAAVAAVLAGNDMLCCTDFEIQIPAVIKAVENGILKEEFIDDAVRRILQWKAELGILSL